MWSVVTLALCDMLIVASGLTKNVGFFDIHSIRLLQIYAIYDEIVGL